MSDKSQNHVSHNKDRWIDRYWWWFLIAFGVACILWLDLFHPFSGS